MNLNKKKEIQNVLAVLLSEGNEVDIPVYGVSMFPFFLPGTKVRIKPAGGLILKPGMVLCFSNGDQLVLHRLIKIKHQQCFCKGDSIIRFDTPINMVTVHGVVVGYWRNKRLVAMDSVLNNAYSWLIVKTNYVSGYVFRYLSIAWLKFFEPKSN